MDHPEECSICLEPLAISAVSGLECSHRFHTKCLVEYTLAMSTTKKDILCPLCRKEVAKAPAPPVLPRAPVYLGEATHFAIVIDDHGHAQPRLLDTTLDAYESSAQCRMVVGFISFMVPACCLFLLLNLMSNTVP